MTAVRFKMIREDERAVLRRLLVSLEEERHDLAPGYVSGFLEAVAEEFLRLTERGRPARARSAPFGRSVGRSVSQSPYDPETPVSSPSAPR